MDIPGLSMDGHCYCGVRGYSDMGGVDIPGLSVDGQSYSGIQGYSDKGGRVDIPGLSMDGHSYSGIRGYSDKGGEGGHPWTIRGSVDGQRYSGIQGYSDVGVVGEGGGRTWTSLDYPWMVTVTRACADWGGKGGHSMTIQGWSQLLRHTGIL